MNSKNAHLYKPLVEALMAGKTIQCNIYGDWVDRPDPTFCELPEKYRIKPEPFELWVNVYPLSCLAYYSEEDAKLYASSDAKRVVVHMREVP